MDIHVIGTSHKHSPVDVRERLSLSEEELPLALESLHREIAEEAAILSTCNRTEIYFIPREEGFDPCRAKDWLREWKGVDVSDEHLFDLHSWSAARHLYDVAAGIDSQVVGDIQIIGQVRQAFHAARDNGTLGKILNRLFTSALHAGKRVKSETELFAGAASISYAAVELARKIFHPLADKKTLVIGAGDAGELAALSLNGQGVRDITIANRTLARAEELCARLGFGRPMPLSALDGGLHEFDIVIASTGAQEYIVRYDEVKGAMSRRSGRMQLYVDISMPRNVDPSIASIVGVFSKDLNDLNNVIESNVARRRDQIPLAEAIITEELEKLSSWHALLPVTPIVARLQQQSEAIMRAELEKNRHRFSERDLENVEKLLGSVVRKIIGMPMSHLLNGDGDMEETLLKAEFVKVLFNLSEEGGEGDMVNGKS